MVGGLKGQSCEGQSTIWSHPGAKPSFLALITGSHARPGTATWEFLAKKQATVTTDIAGPYATTLLHAGKADEALKVLEPHLALLMGDSVQDTTVSENWMLDLEVGAVAATVQGKLDRADALLTKALDFTAATQRCRMRTEQLLVHYLQAYGMEAPLFTHFNSGFYNYLQDSLHWDSQTPDGSGYLMALNVVGLLLQLDGKRQPLYLELLGDLLSKEPNRFNANYMAAIAYLRAGQILGKEAEAAYDRKAMFALEAPRQAEIRFNQYRFTQLKKALQSDADSATMRQNAFEGSEATAIKAGTDPMARFEGVFSNELSAATFEESDFGQLPAILKKSRTQIEARETEVKRYAGDVDLKKEVKKDSRFNAFALFLILTIVGAIVFIWRRVRKATK